MIPTRRELRTCHTCGQSILWTVTRAGARMAVDPRPDERGNQACYRVSPRVWQSRSLDGAGAQPLQQWEHQYVPHVATCKGKAPATATLPPNVIRLDTRRQSARRR